MLPSTRAAAGPAVGQDSRSAGAEQWRASEPLGDFFQTGRDGVEGLGDAIAGGSEVGHVGDIRLFLMAGLLLADELHEARLNGAAPAADAAPATDWVAEALNAVAARLEKIAQGL